MSSLDSTVLPIKAIYLYLIPMSTISQGPRSLTWCYTLNADKDATGQWKPWTDADVQFIPEDLVVYHVYGKELAPETGRPHLQGFVVFKNNKRLSALKKLNNRVHWEAKVRNSTYVQASDYCKKDGDFVEFGSLPQNSGKAGGQATKERYEAMWTQCKAGDFESVDKDLLIRHYHTAKRIRQDYHPRQLDLDNVCGEWIQGKPNTGKSFAARKENEGNYFVKPCNKWWDNYQGEDVVILDDFELDHKCLGHYLKVWADRYAFPAEMKGTTVNLRPKKIIVTSNYTIAQIFPCDQDMQAALHRRFIVRDFDINPPPRITTTPEPTHPPSPITPQNSFTFLNEKLHIPIIPIIPTHATPPQTNASDSELSISDDLSDISYFSKNPLAYTQEIHKLPSKRKHDLL